MPCKQVYVFPVYLFQVFCETGLLGKNDRAAFFSHAPEDMHESRQILHYDSKGQNIFNAIGQELQNYTPHLQLIAAIREDNSWRKCDCC